tara:strand:+ start:3419 stop:4717 length:1299 start_codon:yes stop_codon:yes gene_type:complete
MIEVKVDNCERMPVVELEPFQRNLKNLSEESYAQLRDSIKTEGFVAPIFVWQNKILDGHQRLRVIEREGWEIDGGVPVVKIKAKDEQEAARTLLAIASSYGRVDAQGLAEMAAHYQIDLMDMPSIDLPNFDYEQFLLDFYADPHELAGETDEDEVPEIPDDPITQPGDIWLLGNHRLICGSSTRTDDMERLFSEESDYKYHADMLFTDPPYGVDYEGGQIHSEDFDKRRPRDKLAGDDSDIYREFMPIALNYVDGPCYVWFANMAGGNAYSAVEANEGDISALIIWHKTNATYPAISANYKNRFEPCLYFKPKGSTLRWAGPTTENTVWELKRDAKNDYHPTQKPVELAERAISNHDIETVLDCFGGSGSTLIAAEKQNKRCLMAEIEPKYCDVIVKRWQDYAGKEATLESTGATFDTTSKEIVLAPAVNFS